MANFFLSDDYKRLASAGSLPCGPQASQTKSPSVGHKVSVLIMTHTEALKSAWLTLEAAACK